MFDELLEKENQHSFPYKIKLLVYFDIDQYVIGQEHTQSQSSFEDGFTLRIPNIKITMQIMFSMKQ